MLVIFTKHKKVTISIVFCSIVALIAMIAWFHHLQAGSVIQKNKPTNTTATYTSKQLANKPTDNSSSTDSTKDAKLTVDIPHTTESPKQLQPTTESPKQSSIREVVNKEHVYYPLLTANDPGYASDWAIQKVNAPAAWNISTGNGQTVVAVIDTGFALDHEDLKNNWYMNNGETGLTKEGDSCWTGAAQDKQTNNCDDDGNGYIDDWRGWNFSSGDNNPMAGRVNPNGAAVTHGTETAGLVGATGNNNLGIATINWNTKIMPLQALSDNGPGYTSDIIAAIYYAVDNGANVISMSLGGSEFDQDLVDATNYAYEHNVVVIAAAGNCGTGTEQGCSGLPAGSMSYPALNNHVISVGATTSSDQRASFSSYGADLDVVAPGSGSINSPIWTASNSTSLYASYLNGTSFAAPQVASLASLIKSIRPDSSVDDITALILATATKPSVMNGALYTNEFGHGIINANTALTIASSLNTTSNAPTLLQAGGVNAEHLYSSSDTLGSGCTTSANSYCTIWMKDENTGRDRYLPYQKANTQGITGWTWSGSLIPNNVWQIRAVQGDYRSTAYSLGNK